MRAWISGFALSVALAGGCAFFLAGNAAAQTVPTDNPPATNNFYFNGQYYISRADAESAMRAADPNGALLVKINEFPGPSLTSVTITTRYGFKDRAAQTTQAAGYTVGGWASDSPMGCTAVGVAPYATHCASEAQATANFFAYMQAAYPSCTISNPRPSGAYASPYAGTSASFGSQQGVLHYGADKFFLLDWICSGWTSSTTYSYQLGKREGFVCLQGFYAISNAQPAVNGLKLCRNDITYDITEYNAKPVATCPANRNPCHPATGDKSRAEIDFYFAGRPFIRHYHSRFSIVGRRPIGEKWTHTYTDRLSYTYPYPLIADNGTLENFTFVSGGWYRGENGRAYYKYADGTADLHEPNGDIKRFDSQGVLVSIRNPATPHQDVVMSYDPATSGVNRVLIAVTDTTGRAIQFQYQDGKISSVLLPDGGSVNYAYDVNNNLIAADYGNGQIKSYLYAETGFAAPTDIHALTGIVSESGQRYATFKYDAFERVIYSGLNKGSSDVEVTRVGYPSADSAVATLPNGNVRTYQYDVSLYRRPLSVVDSGGTTSRIYDSTGRLSQSTDQASVVTQYAYTDRYRASVTSGVGTPQQRRVETDRESAFNLPSEMRTLDAANVQRARTNWTYNSRGQTLTVSNYDPVSASSRAATTTYCEQADVTAGTCPLVGLIKTMDGARTDVVDTTTYSYRQADEASCAASPSTCPYRKGDLWKVTNVLNQVSEILKYDGAGRVLSVKDPNNVITDFEYDTRGRLTARKLRGANDTVETDDQITRIEYWPTGMVKKVTQPDGAFTAYTYDDAHRLTGIADNEGNSITYTLNAASERIQEDTRDEQGVLLRTLSRTYNTLGQLQTQADAYNRITSLAYDANSNLDQATDALSRTADNNHDPLNRLSRTLQDMNGIAAETKFTYDVLDNLTQVNDPKGLNTNYTYNGFGDLTQLVSPDTGTTLYTYDSAGNRKTQKDARNKTTTYNYDALNRLTSVTYATVALNTTYTYDTAQTACTAGETFTVGRLTKVVDQSGSTAYCYDRFGNLVRKVQTTNAKVFTLRYTYNGAGQLTSVIYPDGAVADYVYDGQGRVSEIGAKTATGTRQVLLNNVSYYPFGPAAQWTFGTGTSSRLMKRSLNQNYQPGFVEVTAPGGISVGYEFDEVGNLKTLRNANQADPPRRRFGYDALNRLTEAKDGTTNAVLQGYTYDKTGNRTSATVGATTTLYTYPASSHLLNQVGTNTRAYDFNGNTTSIPGTVVKNFVYGDHNRMTQYKEGTTVKMNYVYNGHGEQVRKYATSTTNVYSLYDEAGHWLGDYNNTAATTQQVIWFGDLPVGVLVGAGAAQKLHYIEADALGTPRVVVDPTRGAQGTAVWTWDLAGEAYGTTAPNQNPDGDAAQFVFNMRFPGQRYDSAPGLNYNYFRDYEADTGRYVESDPIGLEGGISTFGYVGGNSMIRTDPLGLAPGDTTYSAWCRHNPGHCAGLAGVGTAITIQSSILNGGVLGTLGPSSLGIGAWSASSSDEGGLASPYVASESVESIVDGLNNRTDGSAITIPWPPKKRGKYICICRVNGLARLSGCATFGYGFGIGETAKQARNMAEGMAQKIAASADTHHTQCKCRDPNGNKFNY